MWPLLLAIAAMTCPSATTLEELAGCIRAQMPRSASGEFKAPTPVEQSDWRTVVRKILAGSCSFPLPASLEGIAELRTFTDTDNGRTYCVLLEVRDADNNGVVDRGWGTFVVDPKAVREIVHQAPHPIADATTDSQAVSIFKGTKSRAWLAAGSHRLASGSASDCQRAYGSADAAHNVDNLFHATNLELMAWYGAKSWSAIQWHGMAIATCPSIDVYLSHGRKVAPAAPDRIARIRRQLMKIHPHWKVGVPGNDACSLNATTNTQGRLLNRVAPESVCDTEAERYTGRFIHIEQDPAFRSASDWIPVINSVWPE